MQCILFSFAQLPDKVDNVTVNAEGTGQAMITVS